MGVTLPLDSSYVGFIFLVVTELLLIRVVVSAQTRSLDREIKRRLDAGEDVELDLRDFGPLKVNPHLGYYKVVFLVFPAALTLLLVALGELGISGRTVPTWSTLKTLTAGSYFALDSVGHGSEWSAAPHQFAAAWPLCVEHNDDSIVARVATIPYELDSGQIVMGEPYCSSQNGVVVTELKSECYEQDLDDPRGSYFNFTVLSVGDTVYYDSFRTSVRNEYLGRTNVTVGEAVVGQCSGKDGGPGIVLWVEADYVDELYAIVDDSWRLDSGHERWIISSAVSTIELGKRNTGNAVIVECEYGCLEAAIEWSMTMGSSVKGASLEEANTFLSIWYEGLNFGEDGTVPTCHDVNGGWTTSGLFASGNCSSAVGESYIPNGGEANVTVVSWWAIIVIAAGCVLTLIYRFVTREGGYNLVTYEGLASVYYTEMNPGCNWRKGSGLAVSLTRDLDSTTSISARASGSSRLFSSASMRMGPSRPAMTSTAVGQYVASSQAGIIAPVL